MAFRTVVISTHSKLEFSLNYLVFKTIDCVKRINIDEIHTLIIESTAVSVTAALLVELTKRKIKIVFCDEKHNPQSELIPYYGDCISYKRISEQIHWKDSIKKEIWKEIIKEKIKQQANVLKEISAEDAATLLSFAEVVYPDDITNREGHAAKFYFNRIYGNQFARGNDDCINSYLNYGYSLLLSQFNRFIVSKGYLTQLGIHHKNEFNSFNLSCDLMEPFRPLVDKKALSLSESNYKDELLNMLSDYIYITDQKQTIVNAIAIYCNSVFSALNNENADRICFYKTHE